jgi:serine/threonine protein kinase
MDAFINSNDSGLLDETLRIKCILGEGGYSTVYKVRDEDKNKEYAAKIVETYCKDEYKINQILTNTNNKHFIKLISFSQGDVKLETGTDFKPYFLFELASKGNLQDYIDNMNGFPELLSKIIFKEILEPMLIMHSKGICHRDIKPKNILLDTEEFIIKITDFGLSVICSEYELLSGSCGTEQYKAPEVLKDKDYDGKKADIFSLGILLLNIMTGKYLFENADYSKDDKIKQNSTVYDYIRLNKDDLLWKKAEKIGIFGLTPEFKKLFLDMVSFDPKKRPSVEDILKYEWMKEVEMLSEDELKNLKVEEFRKREKKINSSKGP